MIQEGWVALIRASRNFDEDRGVQYSTFAYCWIESRISNLLKKDAQTKIAEYGYGKNVQYESIEKEAYLLKELEKLSEHDRKVLELYADGYTVREIADELEENIHYSTVSRHLNKIWMQQKPVS